MTKYLFKQFLHQWRSQGWRVKLELLIIAGILILFIGDKLELVILQWHNEFSISPLRITLFMVLILVAMIYFSGVFLFAFMLPKQKGLLVFYTKPISQTQLMQLLSFHVLKYHLLYMILMVPLIFALASSLGWAYMITAFVIFTLALITIITAQSILLTMIRNQRRFILLSLIIGLIMGLVFWVSAYVLNEVSLFVLCVFLVSWTFIFVSFKKQYNSSIEDLFPLNRREFRQQRTIQGGKTLRLVPVLSVLQALFWKEWYAMWRNPRYRKLKVLTFAVYVLVLVALSFSVEPDAIIWALIFSILAIWFHYSSVFNEKYVLPDSELYFRLRPLKFSQLWLSKFIAESIYVFILIVTFHIYLFLVNAPVAEQVHLVGICSVFALFVLSSMVTFRMMFYEDPRMAGYAYHFMLLFVVIMSINFRLVGPLVGGGLMIYYFYKSYRYYRM